MPSNTTVSLLRLPMVLQATGYRRANFYARIAAKLFTPPVKLGLRCSAWPSSEIDAINQAAIRGATDSEIRMLVQDLLLLRQQAI